MFGRKEEAWLIVGLGNPGKDYAHTRHNAGFRALDILAQKLNCKVDKGKFQGIYGQTKYGDNKLYLLKPLTYMNLSGQSVLQLSAYFHIPPERIIVLFDDISLPPGRLRIRPNGSAGGHNGIKSIIAQVGSQEFPRVKIGVGAKPSADRDLADWVLSAFSAQEEKALAFSLDKAADAALTIVEKGIYEAANLYNGSHPE
jgi:PTH1 family peptidyl-tRNA hydrolase